MKTQGRCNLLRFIVRICRTKIAPYTLDNYPHVCCFWGSTEAAINVASYWSQCFLFFSVRRKKTESCVRLGWQCNYLFACTWPHSRCSAGAQLWASTSPESRCPAGAHLYARAPHQRAGARQVSYMRENFATGRCSAGVTYMREPRHRPLLGRCHIYARTSPPDIARQVSHVCENLAMPGHCSASVTYMR